MPQPLPTLTGTPEQIAVAEHIRRCRLGAIARHRASFLEHYPFNPTDLDAAAALMAQMSRAEWWLETRGQATGHLLAMLHVCILEVNRALSLVPEPEPAWEEEL